ncbi:MAG: hypothetical protein ACI9Y7_000894 [Dokdonia sp.]|jgi:hypothetical protein
MSRFLKFLTIFFIVFLVFSCSSDDDRPSCLDLDSGSDFDPVIMSCQEIQEAVTIDCKCD